MVFFKIRQNLVCLSVARDILETFLRSPAKNVHIRVKLVLQTLAHNALAVFPLPIFMILSALHNAQRAFSSMNNYAYLAIITVNHAPLTITVPLVHREHTYTTQTVHRSAH
jgi:hypothetical protein